MSENSKKSTGHDLVCKNHNARTEKEMYRTCPAKLSKPELEDLYFALLESSLDQKNTINNQKEKIRELSTKLQRMTAAQRSSLIKEQKNCCTMTKAVCNEQKELIIDLKKTNDRLSERIKLLNMKLCSAKQFLQRNSLQSTSKCSKYSITNVNYLKNSSTSALHSKKSDNNLRMTAVSCQCFINNNNSINIRDENSTRAAQTENNEKEKNDSSKLCDENKCRTQMDEFKQKIVNLQEELSNAHNEYSMRITKLESELSDLRYENVRVRSDRTASEHTLQQREKKIEDMADRLRQVEAQYTELAMQLTIERRKVTELETCVKSAQMSNSVVKTIEERLNANEAKLTSLKVNTVNEPVKTPVLTPYWDESSPRLVVPSTPGPVDSPYTDLEKDCTKTSKHSDDSGFTEALNKSQEANDARIQVNRVNLELIDRIDNLQIQLDNVRKNLGTKDDLINSIKESNTDQVNKIPSVRYTCTNSSRKDVWDSYDEVAGCSRPCDESDSPRNLDEFKSQHSPINFNATRKSEEISNIQKSAGRGNINDRMQIPDPLPVDSYDKFKRTSKKRLSNVDRFIKNYYQRKNDEIDFDNNKVTKQVNICNKENKKAPDKDRNEEGCECSEIQAPKGGTDIMININDRKYDDHPEKSKDSIEVEKLNTTETSNVDGLWKTSKDNKVKDTKDLAIRIDELDISRDAQAFGDKTKDTGSTTIHYLDLNKTKHFGVQVKLKELPDKVKRGSIDLLKYKLSRDASKKTENYCEQNKTEEIKFENVIENREREDGLERELCFKSDATLVASVLHECGQKTIDCGVQYEPSEVKELGTQIDSQFLKQTLQQKPNEVSQGSPRTYTVQGLVEVTDHDTDCEISVMTDLPSENEKSPRETVSPGENKLTTTYTDSYTSQSTMKDYRSLSEGELPGFGKATSNKLSQGEKPTSDNLQTHQVSSSTKMEETLHAITEELARCKQLLMSQRPQEVNFLSRSS